MLLAANVSARLILFVMQIDAFGPGQRAIGLVGSLELTHIALFFTKPLRFATSELAGFDALVNSRMLVVLTGVHAWIANAIGQC